LIICWRFVGGTGPRIAADSVQDWQTSALRGECLRSVPCEGASSVRWSDQHRGGPSVIGRRSWQYRTLDPGADRWAAVVWKGRWDPLRTRGCGPAARTPRNLDPREAGWGPTCDRLFSLALPPACRYAIQGMVTSRVPQSVRGGGQVVRVPHPSARGHASCLIVNGCRRSHRSRPDLPNRVRRRGCMLMRLHAYSFAVRKRSQDLRRLAP
jgi:hypothetical protein